MGISMLCSLGLIFALHGGTSAPWITVTDQGVMGRTAYAEYDSTKAIDRAEFIYTADTGFAETRRWQIAPISPEQIGGIIRVSAAVPEGTIAWYFKVYSGILIASSEYTEPASGELSGLSDNYTANRVHAMEGYKIDVAANPARSPRDINGIAALGADHMTHIVDSLDEGAWWPSSIGAIDPLAQATDIASNQIAYVHQAGMKSIGYFRFTADAYCQSNHPDWQCLDRFGAPFPDLRNTDTNREVNVLCLNSDYREFIKIRLQELAARGVDYVYFDWCHMPEVCTCPACRQKYADRYGEPFPSVTVRYSADYLKVAKFISDSMKEAFWYWRESTRAINPDLRFIISGGKYAQHWGDVHISDDFISMADSPKTEFDKDFGGATVYSNQLVSAIPDFYFPDYDLETSIGWSIIRDACNGRAPAVWAPWMRTEDQTLASAGALLGYGCVMDLNLGAMPSTNIYGSVFDLGKTVSPSMSGATVYPWALVHIGEAARNSRIADIVRLWNGFFGPTITAVEALDRERLPYMTITDRQLETGNISTNTKVIILPATNLSAFVSARIAQAESNGVKVIRLYETNAWCRTGTRSALLAGLRATLKDYATNSASRCQISVTGGSDELHVTAYVKPDGKMTVHLIRDWSWLKGRESQTVTPPAGLLTSIFVKRTKPDGSVTSNTVASMEYYSTFELN